MKKPFFILLATMVFIFIILPLTVAYATELPSVEKIDQQIEIQQQAKPDNQDGLLIDLKAKKLEVVPKKRIIQDIRQSVDVDKNHKRPTYTHTDFSIYNFERIDDELLELREDAAFTAEELSEIREREKIYIDALEELLVKSKRYDHFFTKWDDLKESFDGLFAAGSGSFLTALLGWFGFIWKRKHNKKIVKEQSE